MNDFTKEDLNEIARCLKYMIEGGTTPYSCHTISLVKKVRTIIDNYCDHPESMRLLNHGDEWCVKCKGYLGVN